ncbi:kinesin KIF27 isoform X2, partial [Brachionus plicatilis]
MADKLDFKVALKSKFSSKHHSEMEILDNNTISLYRKNYKFNYIFNHDQSPNQTYQCVLDQYLENLVSGINSAIVVYGPASEAKAETLGLHLCSNEKFSKRSKIHFFLNNLFSRLDEEKAFDRQVDFSLSISLSQIHEDTQKSLVGSVNHSLIKVDTMCDIINMLDHINPHQKDSHLFFKIRLEKFKRKKKIFISEINFIDLAGWKYVPGKGDEIIKVKWDLMSLERFLLAKLTQDNPCPVGLLCSHFHQILNRNPKSLLIVCLDPAQPCLDSVEFGSRFYKSLDTKFINYERHEARSNDETIEWCENVESFEEEIEKRRQIHVESEKIQQSQQSDISFMYPCSPLTLKRPNRLCDSMKLYFRGSEKKFKQPELPHVPLNFSDDSLELADSERAEKRRKLNSDRNLEDLKNMFNLMIEDFDHLIN